MVMSGDVFSGIEKLCILFFFPSAFMVAWKEPVKGRAYNFSAVFLLSSYSWRPILWDTVQFYVPSSHEYQNLAIEHRVRQSTAD